MSYTADQLIQAYTKVLDGVAPTPATVANFQVQAWLSANGQLSDAQLLSNIVNGADSTTAVAVLAYQFFTGKSPTKAGIDFLVNSATNTTDLNDAYYAKFNIENRYINFAANLGVHGEGALAFATKYGAMSYAAYVASIYETIIGGSYAAAAGVDAAKAIADIVARKDSIAASAGVVSANMTAAQIDLAVKAATAGYLMGEAIKSDIGIYAAASNNFMIALATGSPIYNVDITVAYKPSIEGGAHGTGKAVDRDITLPGPVDTTPAALSATLTAANDAIAGGAADDTFSATNLTFNAGDVIDGAGGADSLTVTAATGGTYTVAAATVRNIATATVTNDAGLVLNASTWTGLTKLNVTSAGSTTVTAPTSTNAVITTSALAANTLTVNGGAALTLTASGVTTGGVTIGGVTAPTGVVTLDIASSHAGAMGAVQVNGGSKVTVTQTASNANNTTHTNAAVTVNGGAATTSVTVSAPKAATAGPSAAGIVASSVSVVDVNGGFGSTTVGKITTISVDGYTTLNATDNALSTLSLAHGSSNMIIDNSSSLAGGLKTTTLNLTANGLTGGTLDDADVYTTLNITTGAEASTLNNITFGAATALTLAGASRLTLTNATGMANLKTVSVSGAAGLSADLSGATVISVDASASSGANTVTINGNKASFSGGSGVDTVTLSATAIDKVITLGGGDDVVSIVGATLGTGSIDAGGGSADVLKMSAVSAATASGSGTFATKVTGFEQLVLTGATNQTIDVAVIGNYGHVSTSGGNGLTLSNMASGGTLVLSGAGTAYTISNSAFTGGVNDVVNLQLTDGSTAGVSFASTGITAANVETFSITTVDSQATPSGAFKDFVTLLGNSAQTVTVSGNAGLNLTAASTALTTIDASGITLGGFSFTSGALAAAAAIKGSATGANTITFSLATGGAVTYTGGSGADTVVGSNGLNNIVSLGNGANSYTATTGNHQVTGGAGVDAISVGGGANTIDVGSGADSVIFTAATASGASFTAITGMSVGTADTITFTGQAPTAGALGAAVVAGGTLAASLDAAAASAAGSGTPVVTWFVFGGDTYVVLDHSDNTTFTAGVDYAVKLAGTLNLTTSTVAGAVLTL
ncbi:hypothetical protein [Caulobacter sp.]|uniref:hypothetical protein n=1 Tax=Caulobacter sp. TaxID=78 RepID=UPI003BAAA610